MTPAPLYTPRRLTPAHTAATPATDAIGMESDGPTGHQPGMQYTLPAQLYLIDRRFTRRGIIDNLAICAIIY